jgi:hypothetical protein
MNREDIIRMAREAGIANSWDLNWQDKIIEDFAKLVAEHERKIWEQRCERLQSLMDIRETQPNKPCCLTEREACAKVCEEQYEYYGHDHVFAKAIRARGQA